MIYLCCDKRRRNEVDAHPTLNGIDFIEVLDAGAPQGAPRQRTLVVRLLKPVPAALDTDNVIIEGGERISPVGVEWVAVATTPPASLGVAERNFYINLSRADHTLVIRTDSTGDHSTYTLRLIEVGSPPAPPPDFDPLLAAVDFAFKVECPSDFDCLSERVCRDHPPDDPDISYLAKDYASFRRLMLDRIAQIAPAWRDRTPADLGVTLVELLAYVGDHLSYQQDAIATEAYLGTARRRVSVRRHARLVDYAMHDGANARVWVQIKVSADGVTIAPGDRLLTRSPDAPVVIPTSTQPSELASLLRRSVVFEVLSGATLFVSNNTLSLYTWGDDECCLPLGATRATLRGHRTRLEVGQVIIFEEVLGPRTGRPEDADPRKRHAVRLVEVIDNATDPVNGNAITEIRWHPNDALPFPMCISSRTDPDHGGAVIADVSRAVGNVVLADHGRTIVSETLGTVPNPTRSVESTPKRDRCEPITRIAVPPRFAPHLAEGPLTQSAPYDPSNLPGSATAAMLFDVRTQMPAIRLSEIPAGSSEPWEPRRDMLNSGPDDKHFVAEIEGDGVTVVRFGDDRHGRRPPPQTMFEATYRVGNGIAGNVGADSIAHVISAQSGITAVRNPLPGLGGVEPEPIEEVRHLAPYAFRVQERAVTPDDYAMVSTRFPDVQRAAGSFRWTGSWHTVFVTADRSGGRRVTEGFERDLRRHLEAFRMAGYDLEVDSPRFVSLEVDLFACAEPDHFRSDVKEALLEVLSNRVLPNGRKGLFHPDNFTFAQPVYLSAIYAAAQSVPGVATVEVTSFRRQGIVDPAPIADGVLSVGRLEIARLDNNPNFPEHGVLRVEVGGGK